MNELQTCQTGEGSKGVLSQICAEGLLIHSDKKVGLLGNHRQTLLVRIEFWIVRV